jgi:hypothetical protein
MPKRTQRPKGQGAHLWVNQRKTTRYLYLRWQGCKNAVFLGPYPFRHELTAILDVSLNIMAVWRKEHLKTDLYIERIEKLLAADKRERDYVAEPSGAYPELIRLLREKGQHARGAKRVFRKGYARPRFAPAEDVADLYRRALERAIEIRAQRATERKFAKYHIGKQLPALQREVAAASR